MSPGKAGNLNVRAQVRFRNADMIAARERLGINQHKAAEIAGVPIQSYVELEKLDYSRTSTRQHAQQVAAMLELPLDAVLPPGVECQVPSTMTAYRRIEVERLLEAKEAFDQRLILPPPEEKVLNDELSGAIVKVLNTLTYREQEIVKLHFGFDGAPSQTTKQIGDRFKITQMRVRQILDNAIRKLQNPVRARRIEGYVD